MARGRKKKGVNTKIDDLNLVPIMNMMVVLIPVVLVGTSLVKIGVVDVSSKFGKGKPQQTEEKEKPLGLTVALGEKGFTVTATGSDIAGLLGEQSDGTSISIPKEKAVVPVTQPDDSKKDEEVFDYAYRDLYNKLIKIKKAHKKERMVTITASPTIAFKHIVATMDVMRDRLDDDEYGDNTAFRDAGRKDEGKAEERALFDQVVFALAE